MMIFFGNLRSKVGLRFSSNKVTYKDRLTLATASLFASNFEVYISNWKGPKCEAIEIVVGPKRNPELDNVDVPRKIPRLINLKLDKSPPRLPDAEWPSLDLLFLSHGYNQLCLSVSQLINMSSPKLPPFGFLSRLVPFRNILAKPKSPFLSWLVLIHSLLAHYKC